MRRVIKIGLLLVPAAAVVGLGIGRAQKPAEKSTLVAVPAASATAAAPSDRPAASAGNASRPAPKDEFGDPFSMRAGGRTVSEPVLPTPGAVPVPPSRVDAEATRRTFDDTPQKVPMDVPATGVGSGRSTGDRGYYSGYYGVRGDPEVQKLSVEIQKTASEEQSLLAQYAAATNEQERNKLKESLSKVLDRQFDLQQQLRKRELDPIEARLKRLRELIEKRNQARKTIVEKRLDQLLRDAEGMGWTPPAEPSASRASRYSDARFLSDSLARHPEKLGLRGALEPSPAWRSDSAAKGSAAPANGAVPGFQVHGPAKTDALQPGEKGPAAPASAGSQTGAGRVAAGLVTRAEPRAAPALRPTLTPSAAAFAPPSDDASVLTDPWAGQIAISIGANHTPIQMGPRLAVYRVGPGGPTHVGYVDVADVSPDRTVCKIVPESLKMPIQKGDRVATTQFIPPTTDPTKQTQVRVFHLVNGDASSCAEFISVLPAVRQRKVQITVDKRTDCLVVAGPKEDMLVIEALLQRLDTQKTPKVN